MNKLKHILAWLDIHGLFVFSAFLIVFIPLFPKIPIFDVLPGYIVRARPEDILIFITALIWLKDAYKKRFKVKSTYFWMVVLYTISGLISILLGTLLIKSIPAQLLHIGKSSLHLFRYLEYFALFFFTYSSIKTQKQLKIVLVLLAFTILGVVLYGFGQEYLHFPLYSTMNREYSKGTTLYLQEGARPQSTFAGHYDLAAYLVIVLPIIFSLALNTLQIDLKRLQKTIKQKSTYTSIFLHIVHILGAWMLVTSGSKTALLAYVVGIFVVLLLHLQKLGNIKQQLKWGSIAVVLVTIALTIFLNFFALTTRDKFISLIKTAFNGSDIPANPDATPDDLVGDGVVFKQITIQNDDGTERKEWIEEKSTWSQNALKYGLSMGIRLDTLWPNALKGFINNPLFGNGYATLVSISNPGEYSTAESTDNNFLRTIGETGILGFLTFYGFICIIALEIFKQKTETAPIIQALRIGFLGSILGILINATYIDVFAASKVAYTFWAFAGITIAAVKPNTLHSIQFVVKNFLKHWPLYFTIFLALFLLHKNPLHEYALIRDLSISDPQIESLTSAKCFLETGSFTVCSNNGMILRKNVDVYSILLVPFLMINNTPTMFYFLNMAIGIIILFGIYKATEMLLKKFDTSSAKQILIFGSLLLYTLIATALEFSNKPLSSQDMVLFFILLPILIIIFTVLIHTIRYQLAYFTQICAVLIVTLFLANQDFKTTFTNQFRNDVLSDKRTALNLANVHIDTHSFLNREKDYFVITSMNPYYVDLFSNGNYNPLPLSESQPYFDTAISVYGVISSERPLIDQYNSLVIDTNLYATDFQTQSNETLSSAFQNLKNNFDLMYVAIGCNDSCSLFKVSPIAQKSSPEVPIVNKQKISLKNLDQSYSFAVISNRYEPKTQIDTGLLQEYSTAQFASVLKASLSASNSFAVITGDIYHDNSLKSDTIFNTVFNKIPILYTIGNIDLNDSKFHQAKDSYFYTESEFFVLLNVNEDSQISQAQQLFLYNALLQIEKLPTIKNLFIISHNLNWEDRTQPNNFIFELERKLSQYPNLQKYIITSHHSDSNDAEKLQGELSTKHITDPDTNMHYLSSFVRDWKNDSFFEFTVNTDNSVDVMYRVKGENF
ncbi:MAG: hypothetical protein BroJett025_04700 [Patescibacteria group bacterium]|nr:MAG: hypothetical protein BroJett025_04700 [Patescibacteria group bacterium]